MAALKDIAKDCGVSPATVSLALNPYRSVASATRHRVLASAKRLGYSPNAAARMLRSGTTHNIVFAYVKFPGNPAYGAGPGHTLAGKLGDLGYKLEMKGAPTSEALLDTLRDLVRSRAADAYILWGVEKDVEDQALLLESLEQTFIVNGSYEKSHPNWCQVDYDHRGIMRQNVDKLIELGHERIALLNHGNDQTYAVHFRRAFDEIIAERFNRSTPDEWLLEHDETIETGRCILRKLQHWSEMPRQQRPTAIAVGEGGSFGLDMALLSQGIRVGDAPGQFAVAGTGWFPSARVLSGPTWIYESTLEANMVAQMVDRLLAPLLNRVEPDRRILRYLPSLFRFTPEPDIWSSGAIMVNPNWANRMAR